MKKPKYSVYSICLAIQAIHLFCIKYDVDLPLKVVVHISMALRDGTKFEWVPAGKKFKRILFLSKAIHKNAPLDRVANVATYDGHSRKLTGELNNSINELTHNAFCRDQRAR